MIYYHHFDNHLWSYDYNEHQQPTNLGCHEDDYHVYPHDFNDHIIEWRMYNGCL